MVEPGSFYLAPVGTEASLPGWLPSLRVTGRYLSSPRTPTCGPVLLLAVGQLATRRIGGNNPS